MVLPFLVNYYKFLGNVFSIWDISVQTIPSTLTYLLTNSILLKSFPPDPCAYPFIQQKYILCLLCTGNFLSVADTQVNEIDKNL